MIDRWFWAHPREQGESYAEHLGIAARFGAAMILGGLAAIVHGLVPQLFQRTGSLTVRRLNDQLSARSRHGGPPDQAG